MLQLLNRSIIDPRDKKQKQNTYYSYNLTI